MPTNRQRGPKGESRQIFREEISGWMCQHGCALHSSQQGSSSLESTELNSCSPPSLSRPVLSLPCVSAERPDCPELWPSASISAAFRPSPGHAASPLQSCPTQGSAPSPFSMGHLSQALADVEAKITGLIFALHLTTSH